ncbi:MAG: 50S ribosomal protein L29 [Gammaproteobacteria bacterium]|nr:50S ribosomal protein L29 [Gammaproteobacteria bacterium]
MNASELRGKDMTELEKELLALRREQFNLRMQQGGGQAPRPDQFAKVRKNIARIKTVMTEKLQAGN